MDCERLWSKAKKKKYCFDLFFFLFFSVFLEYFQHFNALSNGTYISKHQKKYVGCDAFAFGFGNKKHLKNGITATTRAA